jgi:hypothetical protein
MWRWIFQTMTIMILRTALLRMEVIFISDFGFERLVLTFEFEFSKSPMHQPEIRSQNSFRISDYGVECLGSTLEFEFPSYVCTNPKSKFISDFSFELVGFILPFALSLHRTGTVHLGD